MPITFHQADVKLKLPYKKELKQFITTQIEKAGYKAKNISYVFCSDEYLLDINRRFLNHDYYTDIITFPLSEDLKNIESEIYISLFRVEENAKKYRPKTEDRGQGKKAVNATSRHLSSVIRTFDLELQRVVFHGVLHLLGYKDKTRAQQAEMRKMEELWLKKFKSFLKDQNSKTKDQRAARPSKTSHKPQKSTRKRTK